MLGSLARKLRAFGFDVGYFRKGADAEIVSTARREKRVILTADRALAASAAAAGAQALLLEGRTDGRRIAALLARASEAGIPLRRGPPRCSACGGELHSMTRRDAEGLVPPSVLGRHRLFRRCPACGKTYWRGGHWKKLSDLERAFGPRPRMVKGDTNGAYR